MSAHCFNPPSAAWRWVNCNGSPTLEAAHPEAQSQEAMEGDAAHDAAATMLRNRKGGSPIVAVEVGGMRPNGIVLTDEMLESAESFVDLVLDKVGPTHKDTLHIEERVELPAGRFGTPDAWWASIGPTGGYLFIADFKFGHRFVDAFENLQLIDYVDGILRRPEFAAVHHDKLQVEMYIHQPRNYHPVGPTRRWVKSAADLAPYFARLHEATTRVHQPDARTVVGPWCQDCTGRHACEALQSAADGAADLAGGTVSLELPPAALGTELRMLKRAQKLLDARVSGMEEQAKSIIRQGARVPGWTLEQGTGRENWTVPVGEVIALGQAFGIDAAKPAAAITPAQLRKAGVPKELVDGFAQRPPGALNLVAVDDNDAAKAFSK